MPITVKDHKGGGIDISITCDKCGQPIIGSDELGFFCKNRCYDAENKKAKKKFDKIFGILEKLNI